MRIKRHILLIMCLQRDHHPMFLRIADRVIHKLLRNSVVLHIRAHREIDDM